MENKIELPAIQNADDLQQLLVQYGGLLSPQNQALIKEILGELEGEQVGLEQLLIKVQNRAQAENASYQQQTASYQPEVEAKEPRQQMNEAAITNYRRFAPK